MVAVLALDEIGTVSACRYSNPQEHAVHSIRNHGSNARDASEMLETRRGRWYRIRRGQNPLSEPAGSALRRIKSRF